MIRAREWLMDARGWCNDWAIRRIVRQLMDGANCGGEKLMEKRSLKTTKDRWVPDWYMILSWERFFFSCQTWGFGNGKQSDKKRRRQFKLIGSWSLWHIGSKSFLTWQGRRRLERAHKHTHTQNPDTCPYTVTFYLSFLFIIAWQCKRQTGKGYDVNEREFVANLWSGSASGGGHFSCG